MTANVKVTLVHLVADYELEHGVSISARVGIFLCRHSPRPLWLWNVLRRTTRLLDFTFQGKVFVAEN